MLLHHFIGDTMLAIPIEQADVPKFLLSGIRVGNTIIVGKVVAFGCDMPIFARGLGLAHVTHVGIGRNDLVLHFIA